MDIVVRTPHGDADVSIASHAATTTLGDVVAAVTGQAVPRLVLVDGGAVDATTPLDDVELLVGSLVASEPSMPAAGSDADVDLVQIAGHGTGRVMRLRPGRYRIGPGRRSNADELEVAPVERTVFELVVAPTSSASEVSIEPPGPDSTRADATTSGVTIDGVDVDGVRAWHQGTLTVGARAFQIDSPARSEPARARSVPDRDGTLAFGRPPRRTTSPQRRPVVDALHDAVIGAPTLWERRPGHPDAFVVPIGIRADDAVTATADLGSNRALAVVGSERWRGAFVRSLVVEAVTLHGPADLDVVVLTDPDRVGDWDWAKWLPHLRQGGRLDGAPAVWSSRHDVSRWCDDAGGGPTPPRLTMVILDDPALWNRREAPARSIVSNPPDHLRLIALCDDEGQAPAICTTMIAQTDGDLAHIHSFTRSSDDEVIRPALTESGIAVRVARALAPLADIELTPRTTGADAAGLPIAVSDLVGATDIDQVLTRWVAADARPTATIGRRGHESVDVPVAAEVTVVIGSSMGDAFDVAATSLLAQCVDRPPDALWIAPMVLEHSARSALLWQLPHATEHHDVDSPIDPRRLIARLRAVLADPAGPARIVVVTEAPGGAATTPGATWLSTLATGVRGISGLTMVVVTDRPELAELLGDTVVRVERRYDEPGIARRIALLAEADGTVGAAFSPLQPTASPATDLELRPFVVGRALTPLERRIEKHLAQTANAPNPAFDSVVALLRDAAARRNGDEPVAPSDRRTVVPPQMPTRVDLVDLFARSPGDGVPLGLVDDPEHAGVRTRWWEPRSGSMLVFGSRRSGMEQVIATIVLGVLDRFSALDVRMVLIESSATRRRALAGLGGQDEHDGQAGPDGTVRVVDPDRSDDVAEALEEIGAELDRCADTDAADAHDRPRTVLLIGDLVHLRRRYADQRVGVLVDEIVTRAAAPGSGVDVVAAAADLDGAGPFAAAATHALVGASSDVRELAALGVEHPSDLDGIVGRCRSFPDGELVQLATTDAPIETLLARRSIGGTA